MIKICLKHIQEDFFVVYPLYHAYLVKIFLSLKYPLRNLCLIDFV